MTGRLKAKSSRMAGTPGNIYITPILVYKYHPA